MKDLHRAIITRIISDAVSEGYELEVFNGEETIIRHSRDEREIMAALESTNEDQLRFRRNGKRAGFVRLVYRNEGWGVANEYAPALEPIMVGARGSRRGRLLAIDEDKVFRLAAPLVSVKLKAAINVPWRQSCMPLEGHPPAPDANEKAPRRVPGGLLF